MYFSMLLSFERSCARQRRVWIDSSKAGGVKPCFGFWAATEDSEEYISVVPHVKHAG